MLSSLTRLTLGCILHLLLPRGQSRYNCHRPPTNLLGPRSSYFCHFYWVLGIIWNKPPTLGDEKSHAWQSLSKKWKGGRVSPRPEGDCLRAQVGLEERRLDRHLGDRSSWGALLKSELSNLWAENRLTHGSRCSCFQWPDDFQVRTCPVDALQSVSKWQRAGWYLFIFC